MASSISVRSLRDRLTGSWRILAKEVSAFGLVGALAFVVQVGVFNFFFHRHFGPLISNTIAMVLSTMVAYLGNRNWSFSHRARLEIGREASYFFGINFVAYLFAQLMLATFAYPLHYKADVVVMNVVSLVAIGIGTVFRFWAYKRFVFLHPDRVHSRDVDLAEELAE